MRTATAIPRWLTTGYLGKGAPRFDFYPPVLTLLVAWAVARVHFGTTPPRVIGGLLCGASLFTLGALALRRKVT